MEVTDIVRASAESDAVALIGLPLELIAVGGERPVSVAIAVVVSFQLRRLDPARSFLPGIGDPPFRKTLKIEISHKKSGPKERQAEECETAAADNWIRQF